MSEMNWMTLTAKATFAENIGDFLPLLIPLILVQFGLMAYALVHILKHDKYKMGNRVIWIVVSCLLSIIGPILYIVLGKEED